MPRPTSIPPSCVNAPCGWRKVRLRADQSRGLAMVEIEESAEAVGG